MVLSQKEKETAKLGLPVFTVSSSPQCQNITKHLKIRHADVYNVTAQQFGGKETAFLNILCG